MTGAFAARPILRIRSPIIGRGEQIFELSGSVVTIGRADDCDVVLLEQAASRVHARLVPEGDGWLLVDEGSHAGVFVGGKKVARHVLVDGERFRIGETDFQLVARPAAQPTILGATRPPAAEEPLPSIAVAPTLSSEVQLHEGPSPAASPPVRTDAPNLASLPRPPTPPPPPAAAPAAAPMSTHGDDRIDIDGPPFAAPLPAAPRRPPMPIAPASAPSFVDFGPVGRPNATPGDSQSFSGHLVDDPSRIGRVDAEARMSSQWGTWLLVVLLFVGLSLVVLGLAYDVTLSDVMSAFG